MPLLLLLPFSQFDGSLLPLASADNSDGRYELILEGVSTAADVVVNGHVVGRVADVHAPFAFDVTSVLAATGRNSLELRLTNAVDYARGVASGPEYEDPTCKKFPRTRW